MAASVGAMKGGETPLTGDPEMENARVKLLSSAPIL
jgi:hypothetical protein